MRLISRHILGSLLAPFFWGVAALTGLLLLNSLPPLIEQFGGKGLPARIMIEGVLLFLPALLSLTLPMAVLVSTLYGYSQLAAALEMVAMYANGLSVWRMARPALIGAAVIAVINFIVFDQVMPKSNIRFNNLRLAAINTSPTLALQQQVLNLLPPSGYVLRADVIDPTTSAMRGVTIFDLSGFTGGRRLIVADSGSMSLSSNKQDLILTLHSGVIYEFARDRAGQLQQTNFAHNRVTVPNVQSQFQFNPNSRVARGELEKNTCELLDDITDARWTAANARRKTEYYTSADLRTMAGAPSIRLPSEPVKPVFAPHCGIYRKVGAWFQRLMLPQKAAAQSPGPSAHGSGLSSQQQPVGGSAGRGASSGPRAQGPGLPVTDPTQNPMVTPQGPQFLVQPPAQATQGNALPSASFDVQMNVFRMNDAQTTARRYRVEFYRKFAVPLSTFCFVLIGMALALKYPASGIGLVIGGSLVIFLGFYILLQGGIGAAKAGHLDPALAMFAPLTLFTVIGLVAVNAANREMGTARASGVFGSILEFFRGLRG